MSPSKFLLKWLLTSRYMHKKVYTKGPPISKWNRKKYSHVSKKYMKMVCQVNWDEFLKHE